MLESRGSGVARCECDPSAECEEIRDAVASCLFKDYDLELHARERPENESEGSDSLEDTCVREAADQKEHQSELVEPGRTSCRKGQRILRG